MNKLLDSKRINDSAEELFGLLLDKVRELSPEVEFDKLYLRGIFDMLSSRVEAEFLEEMVEYYRENIWEQSRRNVIVPAKTYAKQM